jgi:hypothetical protein
VSSAAAVWLGGRVPAVSRSYRTHSSLPGGGIRRGEEPREAARTPGGAWAGCPPARPRAGGGDGAGMGLPAPAGARIRVAPRAEPVLRIDTREIVAARLVEPRVLLAEAVLPPFLRAHLCGERRSAWSRGWRACIPFRPPRCRDLGAACCGGQGRTLWPAHVSAARSSLSPPARWPCPVLVTKHTRSPRRGRGRTAGTPAPAPPRRRRRGTGRRRAQRGPSSQGIAGGAGMPGARFPMVRGSRCATCCTVCAPGTWKASC